MSFNINVSELFKNAKAVIKTMEPAVQQPEDALVNFGSAPLNYTESIELGEMQDIFQQIEAEQAFQYSDEQEIFISSIENQNDREFAKLLLNAGCSEKQILEYIKENEEEKELQETQETIDNYLYNQTNELTQYYLNKPYEECTQDEINNVYALSMIESVLVSSQGGLKAQDDADGWVSETYDWMKDVTGLGVAQSDVEDAIRKQENILNTLKTTLQTGKDFEGVFKALTGVEYNPEKIAEYYQKTTELQFVSIGAQKIQAFHQTLKSDGVAGNPEKMLEAYVQFYGDEQIAREKFGEDILLTMEASGLIREGYYKEFYINENNEYVYTYQDGETCVDPIGTVFDRSITREFCSEEFLRHKTDEYLSNFEKATGINYETLVKEQQELSKEALGEANAVANLLNEYVASQEGFIDGLSSVCQIGGMVCMGLGAIVSFIPLPGARLVGGGMMGVGKWAAIGGTFGDEVLELFDTATNNQGWDKDKEHYKETGKDLLTDAALFAAGYGAGTLGGKVGEYAINKYGSKALAKLFDIGADSAMSLMSDLIITGEIDFQGEGFSQLLGILTGSATARLNASGKTKTPKLDWSTKTDPTRIPDNYQDIYAVFKDSNLNKLEKERAKDLYKHIKSLGYETFMQKHPQLFVDMFRADTAYLSGYHTMGPNEYLVMKYAQDQIDAGLLKPEWIKAIDERMNMSTPIEVFKYWDNKEAVPAEGVKCERFDMSWNRDWVFDMIDNEIMPLRECLEAQSIPADIVVHRIEDVNIFRSMEMDGVPMSELLLSKDPATIDMLLKKFNAGGFEVVHENFIGTSLGSHNGYHEEIEWIIDVPKGSKGMFMELDNKDVSSIVNEKEFVLQMGTVFNVRSATYNPENGRWTFEVGITQE